MGKYCNRNWWSDSGDTILLFGRARIWVLGETAAGAALSKIIFALLLAVAI